MGIESFERLGRLILWLTLASACVLVPIEYIKPLRPIGVGERVVVIGGDKVGTHALVHSNTDGRWALKALDDSTIITYIEDKEQLCLSAS